MTYCYLRVSSDTQETINQKSGIEEWCKKRGIVIDVYIDDTNRSGTLEPEKRQLGKLLEKLQKGDVLIAGEISRLGRSLFMIMRILEHCMNVGVKVYTVKDGYELGDNITSKVLAFAFGLSAEIEREMISRRTKEALALRKAQGIHIGRRLGSKNAITKISMHKDYVFQSLKEGKPKCHIAEDIGVDRTTLWRWLKENA